MSGSNINVVLALMIIGSFLVAIILHECGHALVASWLGDPTPRREGRLSFNLLSHLDPVGTLLAVILAFLPVGAGPVGLGWGKPVKSDPWKLRGGPNAGTLFVAIGVLRFVIPLIPSNAIALRLPQLITVFASVNISLAIFNILPLYPLDGYQILYTLLPSRQAMQFARSAPYGPFIILALLFLLPFLGQLSGLGNFFLFHIPYYILLGSFNIIAAVSGLQVDIVTFLYVFNLINLLK